MLPHLLSVPDGSPVLFLKITFMGLVPDRLPFLFLTVFHLGFLSYAAGVEPLHLTPDQLHFTGCPEDLRFRKMIIHQKGEHS